MATICQQKAPFPLSQLCCLLPESLGLSDLVPPKPLPTTPVQQELVINSILVFLYLPLHQEGKRLRGRKCVSFTFVCLWSCLGAQCVC